MDFYLHDIIVKTAYAALNIQSKDGSFPSGHNGPHFDNDTPCRNTSHWIITLLKAYELTNDTKFKKAALLGAEYLCTMRLSNGTFWHRISKDKDRSNGLIGQAWTIEAMLTLHKVLGSNKYFDIAHEVYTIHPFNFRLGLWHDIDEDGRLLPVKPTINQQIWFAAVGSYMSNYDHAIYKQIERFLDRFSNNIRIKKNGLIRLRISPFIINKEFLATLLNNICFLPKALRKIKTELRRRVRKEVHMIETGYHSFALYGLALLRMNFHSHRLWKSEVIRLILDYLKTNEYYNDIEDNVYSYGYNPAGFEVAFTVSVFSDYFINNSDILINEFITEQFARCFNFDSCLLERNSIDSNTLAARFYECVRLPNDKLDLPV